MATELTLTPLPDGVAGRDLRLSLHVGPRLTDAGPNAVLAGFPLMVDWPATIANVAWSVEIDGRSFPATLVSSPSSALWTELFPAAGTKVFSHEVPDFREDSVHSNPVAAVEDFVKSTYGVVGAQSPTDFPPMTTLRASDRLGPLAFLGEDPTVDRASVEGQLRAQREGPDKRAVSAPNGVPEASWNFLQVLDFHKPPTTDLLPHIPLIEVDFHRAVSAVQAYPTLLRALGLVLDLRVSLAGGSPSQGEVTVQATATWSDATLAPVALRPNVASELEISQGLFAARPRPAASPGALVVVDGMLPLEDAGRYRVVTLDTDGAAEKLVTTAGGLNQAVDHEAADTPSHEALPALRSSGIAVARVDMAGQLHESVTRSAKVNDDLLAGGVELYAEDLVRGGRVDVYDIEHGVWRSLCGRAGQVRVGPGATVVPESTEGWISTAPTGPVDPDVKELYQPETLFHWTGWSLAVEPPGAQVANRPDVGNDIVPGETTGSNAAVARTPEVAHPDLPLTTDLHVPKASLPRLRYGGRYRLRVRTVDLAGNGLGPDDLPADDFTHATPEVAYRRYEPVQSPPVYLRDEPVPAEEVERIVIRTDNDSGAASTPVSERHVVPPMQTSGMVEQLGELDTGPQGSLDPAAFAMLASRDGAQLGPDLPTPNGPWVLPVTDFDGVYRLTPAQFLVPYLPDPLTRGAALTYQDGPHAGRSVLVDYAVSPGWPHVGSLRLRALHGSGPARVTTDPAGLRVLDVPLRPAEVTHIRLSSLLHQDREHLMAVWRWIEEYAEKPGLPLDELLAAVRQGRHWMLTPFRVLVFVHAVKQPLHPPAMELFEPSRHHGWTHTELGDLVRVDRPSTQEVAVVGSWSEPVDEGPRRAVPDVSEPFSQATRAVAFRQSVDYAHPDGTDGLSPLGMVARHEFNDTKRRDVRYELVATSRFTEHFTQIVTVASPGPGQSVVVDPAGVAEGTLVLTRDGGAPLTDYDLDPASGTVTFGDGATGNVPPVGVALAARYVPGSVTRASEAKSVVVPSSARPAAPSVRYLIPTFGWESEQQDTTRTSRRRGGGLRVYLDRPWWSSGRGELLGVVLPPPTAPGGGPLPLDLESEDATKRFAPFVTQWGSDPLYAGSGLPHRYPLPSDFTSAVTVAEGVGLAETGQNVDVAGHAVGFDADRDLWFSDITVATAQAYSPFIRLALVRYQPESVPPLHLSPVVVGQFSQLAPDRFATVTADGPRAVRVYVVGPAPYATESGTESTVVEVTVERRETVWGDDEVGWRPVGSPTVLTLAQFPAPGWSGRVTVRPSSNPQRIVIAEYERLRTDDQPMGQAAGATYGRRPVYTDIIDLH